MMHREPNIPQSKMLKVFQVIHKLHEKQWTIQELAVEMDIPYRTMCRYWTLIKFIAPDSYLEYVGETDKHQVRPRIIQLLDCPLCGKNVHKFSIKKLA